MRITSSFASAGVTNKSSSAVLTSIILKSLELYKCERSIGCVVEQYRGIVLYSDIDYVTWNSYAAYIVQLRKMPKVSLRNLPRSFLFSLKSRLLYELRVTGERENFYRHVASAIPWPAALRFSSLSLHLNLQQRDV